MFTHAKSRSLLFQGDPAVIGAAVPTVAVDGVGFNLAVRHTASSTMKLREIGVDAPSPIMSYYDWPKFKGIYDPFDHQRSMAEFMSLRPRCFNLGEMGTGKTNSVLWATDFLMKEGTVTGTAIVAPLSTLERVWVVAIMETVMHRKVVVVHGSREKRLKALATPADFYIINHEGLAIGPILEALRTHPTINHIVVDEGSKFRNSKTDKYRSLEKLVSNPKLRLWWLTGTPCPTGPDNAWAQIRLVNPGKVPKFFGAFRSRVMIEVSEHNWKPKAGSDKIVHEAMQPAIRVAKEDCLDLPPIIPVDLACEMSPEQDRAFKQMAAAMQVADKAAHEGGTVITAVNAADRINKLRQIMLGSVKGPNDTYVTYDYAPRLKVLFDAIEQAHAKVIVVAPFKGIIQDLEREIAKKYSVAMVNGDVSIGRRNKIFASFKENRDPHVLLCHPSVMSHGLNLVEADTLIFFGAMYGNDEYRQVIERYNRPPQDKKLTCVRIGCNPIEWAIYRSLDSDEQQQQQILKLYKSIINGDAL